MKHLSRADPVTGTAPGKYQVLVQRLGAIPT
jgi:hypothetical protein